MNDARTLQDGIEGAGSAIRLLWREDPPVWAPPVVQPEYSGWRTEQHAWHEAVTIADLSYHMWDTFIEGPDALRLLSELSANDYKSFALGQAKQFLPVTEEGLLVIDGILARDAADRFTLSGVPPAHSWVRYHAERGGYDVQCRTDPSMEFRPDGTPHLFRMQIQGPLAGELVLRAFGAPLPETKFFHSVPATLAGRDFRALRHGMSGQAGWEFIGDFRDHDAVKDALLAAGEPLGLAHIGAISYPTGGVESGWVPCPLPAIYTAPSLADYRRWLPLRSYEGGNPLHGSWYSDDIEDYYRSPYDLGYGRFVSFDHDFIGRDALRDRSWEAPRSKVSLVWHEPDATRALGPDPVPYTLAGYRVESGDGLVGATAATAYLDPTHRYLSLAIVDRAHAAPGTELDIVVGRHPGPGTSPDADLGFARVRATVHPAPYNDYARTEYRRNVA